MTAKYIERADAVRTVMEKPDMTLDEKAGVVRRLQALPAADVVEVRHGHWERVDGYPYPACSECGCESLSRADRPYCQFCGARMDGGQDR